MFLRPMETHRAKRLFRVSKLQTASFYRMVENQSGPAQQQDKLSYKFQRDSHNRCEKREAYVQLRVRQRNLQLPNMSRQRPISSHPEACRIARRPDS